MKKVVSILVVSLVFGLVFSFSTGLYAGEKEEGNKCCAVCGTAIAKDGVEIKTEYKGKTYYFASEDCKAKFEKEPDKFLEACGKGTFYYCSMKQCDYRTDKPGKCPKCGMELKKHEPKTVYVCPMKQCNVQADEPGKCPKCGMELKKKAVCCSAEEGHAHKHGEGHQHSH